MTYPISSKCSFSTAQMVTHTVGAPVVKQGKARLFIKHIPDTEANNILSLYDPVKSNGKSFQISSDLEVYSSLQFRKIKLMQTCHKSAFLLLTSRGKLHWLFLVLFVCVC